MASEQASSHRQLGLAHSSLADVLDALESMGVNVVDEEIDYAGEAVVESAVAEVSIAAELPGEISLPSDEQADPALVEQLQDDLDESEAEAAALREERNRLQDRVDDLEAQIEEGEIERLKDELDSARGAQTDLKELVDELEAERDEAVAEVKRLNEQLAEVPNADDLEEIEDERDRLQERSEQLAETINQQAWKIAELQSGDREDAEEIVFVAGNGANTFHAREDCRKLQGAKNVYEKDPTVLAEAYSECPDCHGDDEAESAAEELVDEHEPDEDDAGAEERDCPWPDCDYSGNERGVAIHVGRAHDGEEPGVEEFLEPVDDEEAERLQDALEEGNEADVDVTPMEQTILDAIEAEGETTSTVIGEEVDISTSSVSTHLSNLRGKGLVEGREHPDSANRKLYSLASDAGDEEADVEAQPEGNVQEDPDEDGPDREQFVLDILDEEGAMRVGELREYICDEFGVDVGAARYTYEEMAEAGDLARWADPDDSKMSYYGLPDQKPESVGEPEAHYPRDCGTCGATLEDSVGEAVHRTEEHGTPQSNLGRLEQGEFEEIIEEADDVNAIVDEVPFAFEKVLRLLGVYGLGDVVGGDVELSDVTAFEFDGIDEPEGEDEPADGPDVQKPAPDPDDPPTAAKICMRHDLDRDEVVDAIADAQGSFHVRRDLGLPADVADTLLNELGFLEEMKGTGHVGRARAKGAVHKHVPRSVGAGGGGRRA